MFILGHYRKPDLEIKYMETLKFHQTTGGIDFCILMQIILSFAEKMCEIQLDFKNAL